MPLAVVRVPYLLSVIWAVHVTLTAPQPPPRFDERAGPVGWEVSIMPPFLKLCCWTAGVAEILVVIDKAYPSDIYPASVTAFLACSHLEPSNIRLTWTFILGSILAVFGAIIRLCCYRAMGDMFTFELSLRNRHRLITTGPYSVVRHPSYTGAMLVLFGALACHTTSGSWAIECARFFLPASTRWLITLCWTVSILVGVPLVKKRIGREDEMFSEHFGSDWDAWANNVTCRLIPGVY